jgi:hypothetical protein
MNEPQAAPLEDAWWSLMEQWVRMLAAAAAASVDVSVENERFGRALGLPVLIPAPVQGGEVQ